MRDVVKYGDVMEADIKQMTMDQRLLNLLEESGNILTEPPTIDVNKEFDKMFNYIPYWEKDTRFINPDKEPEPILTWGVIENTPAIEKQGIAMITATPGEGKTTTVISIILAITTGKKIGNFTPTSETPAKCIVFDTEQSDNDIFRKIQILKRTNGGTIPDNLRFVSLVGMPKKERITTIMGMVRDYEPDIIVVDTITRLTTDFNDPKESQEFEDLLLPISRYKSVVGVMHHTFGTEKAKGHLGSIMEEVGQQVWIAKRKTGGIFTLKAKKIRNYDKDRADCFEVMLDPKTGNLIDATAKNTEQAETRKAEFEEMFSQIFGKKEVLEPDELYEGYKSYSRLSGMEPVKKSSFEKDLRKEAMDLKILSRKRNPKNKNGYLYYMEIQSHFAELDFDDL